MKLVPMRFKGVSWHHNPREINFACEKQLNELKSPYGRSVLQNTGRKCMVISGEGELYGEDCMQQFDRLLQLFKSGGSGVLAIPRLSPVYAVFESVKINGVPKPDVLCYSFVFREIPQKDEGEKPMTYLADSGETLWDVSYRFDVVIDELVRLNPQVKRPDLSLEGKVVRLC